MFMCPKGGIHNIQSIVINLTVHSEGLSLHFTVNMVKGRISKFGMSMHLRVQSVV